MKFNVKFPLFILTGFLLFSCASTYMYGPGNLGHESRIFLTPISSDSSQLQHYVTGRYSLNAGQGYSPGESCNFGEASYHLGYSRKFISCGAGGMLFGGVYQVKKFEISPGWKNFYGFSASGQVALNIPLGNYFNWRILGVRSGLAMEGGELYNFRMRYRDYPGFNEYFDRQLMGHAGSFSEMMFQKNGYRLLLNNCNTILFGKGRLQGFNSAVSAGFGYQQYTLQYQYTASSHGNTSQSLGLILRFF